MLDACYGPRNGNEVAAFESLVTEAFRRRDQRTREQDLELLLTRRRAARAASHKGAQEGATPSDGIVKVTMDRELGQAPSTVSKAVGARKGLGCESSAIRHRPREAS